MSLRMDDYDRCLCMVDKLLRDRSKKKSGKSAVTSRTYDYQLRVLSLFDDEVGRGAFSKLGVDLDFWVVCFGLFYNSIE